MHVQVVLLDDENPKDHLFADFLHYIKPHPRLVFQTDPGDIFPSKICGRGAGYDRQMWSGYIRVLIGVGAGF